MVWEFVYLLTGFIFCPSRVMGLDPMNKKYSVVDMMSTHSSLPRLISDILVTLLDYSERWSVDLFDGFHFNCLWVMGLFTGVSCAYNTAVMITRLSVSL